MKININRRVFAIILAATTCVTACVAGCSIASFLWQSEIGFQESSVYLGKCGPRDVVSGKLKFFNRTDDAVLIERVIASCGCIASDMQGHTIPPHSEKVFPVGFNAQKTATSDSVIEKTIAISTNRNGHLQVWQVKLTVDVVPHIILPDDINLTIDHSSEIIEKDVIVRNNILGNVEFSEMKVESILSGCKLDEISSSAPRTQERRFRCEFKAPIPSGRRTALRLIYAGPNDVRMERYIGVSVSSPYRIEPSSFVISKKVDQSSSWMNFTVFSSSGNNRLRIAGIRGEDAKKIEWKTIGSKLQLRWLPKIEKNDDLGRIEKINLLVEVLDNSKRFDIPLKGAAVLPESGYSAARNNKIE
ncbi:MAG: DUF1573 domain-containing protein [Planctomycetales bacterium]|nr:DUF1573 domain-containing protein [Planctomycetales bacterium]